MLFHKSNWIANLLSQNFIKFNLFVSNTKLRQQIGYLNRMSNFSTNCAPSKSIVAVGQMKATNDKDHNLKQVEELVKRAKSENAQILFLPECCDFVGEFREQTLELSEPLEGKIMTAYKNLAKENCIWLSLGGLHEKMFEKQQGKCKLYNAHVLVNSIGEIVHIYRKLHLFDVETEDFRFKESDIICPGAKLLKPVDTPFGKIGLQICYDVRFGEASMLLKRSGAQILTFPAAFAYGTGKYHWDILLRARAIENQCFVIAAAQLGFHNKKRQSWGHAMIVDPWGSVLGDCGGEEELAIKTVEIDLGKIEKIQKNMPVLEHRRNDIYSLTAFNYGTVCADGDQKFADNIIKKDTIFYETEHCYAFTNLRCVVEGHVLVSTKKVTPRLNGLNCAEMTDLFSTVCHIQRMLEAFYKTGSATVTVQDGSLAGQTVPHVHFHVMPRRVGDFPQNDQIYVKLDDRCEDKPCRTIEERIEEAQMYRQFIAETF